MKHRCDDVETMRGAARLTAAAVPLALAVVCGGVASAQTSAPQSHSGPANTVAAPPGSAAVGALAARTPRLGNVAAPLPAGRPTPPGPAARPADRTLRLGDIQVASPSWLPEANRLELNMVATNAGMQIAALCRSTGTAPGRCDHIAGGAVAGGFVGGAAAALPLAVPVAMLGGVVGGLLGGVVATVAAVPYLLLPPFSIAQIIAGGVGGAGLGGAALGGLVGAPLAAAGALAGAMIGGAVDAVR